MACGLKCFRRNTKLGKIFPKPRHLLTRKKLSSLVVEKKHGVQDRERSEINLIFHVIMQQLLSASIFYSLSGC